MQAKSTSEAIIKGKCPKCRKGDMFVHPLHQVSQFSKMNTLCPECGLRFEVEPGFFVGAMYVSYVITVGLLITTGILLYFLGVKTIWVYMSAVFGSIIALLPIIFRYSRIIFLHFFGGIKYDKSFSSATGSKPIKALS